MAHLVWVFAGLLIWYAIREFSPALASVILAAIVILAVVKVAPMLAVGR